MTVAATRTLLERNTLFRGLPNATLEEIVTLARRKSYQKNTTIFMQGDPGDALYGIVAGKVRVSSRSPHAEEVFLNILEPGDCFGEIAMLDGEQRTATAVATEDCDMVVIQREQFMQLLRHEPELTLHLLHLCCQRVRWTSELIEDSAFLSSAARLAKRLLYLARQHGTDTERGRSLKISQNDLANFLRISRQLVNQLLQDWARDDWVALGRGKVTIVNEEALLHLVEGG